MIGELVQAPSPIWRDDVSTLTVWVNGGTIEITLDSNASRSGPLGVTEVAPLPAEFASAIAEAQSWCARWDSESRSGYHKSATSASTS